MGYSTCRGVPPWRRRSASVRPCRDRSDGGADEREVVDDEARRRGVLHLLVRVTRLIWRWRRTAGELHFRVVDGVHPRGPLMAELVEVGRVAGLLADLSVDRQRECRPEVADEVFVTRRRGDDVQDAGVRGAQDEQVAVGAGERLAEGGVDHSGAATRRTGSDWHHPCRQRARWHDKHASKERTQACYRSKRHDNSLPQWGVGAMAAGRAQHRNTSMTLDGVCTIAIAETLP